MGNIFAKKITNNDGWLWKNKKYYLTDKVNKIILPGTHDSGAYKLDWLIAGAKGNAVLNTLRMIGIVVPWVRVILNGWTITHNLSPYNQLKLGIRSLDLRMYYDEPTKRKVNNLSTYGNLLPDTLFSPVYFREFDQGSRKQSRFPHLRYILDHKYQVFLLHYDQ